MESYSKMNKKSYQKLARIGFSVLLDNLDTAQKMKFSIKDFFSKCDPHLLKKPLMEDFIFLAVWNVSPVS